MGITTSKELVILFTYNFKNNSHYMQEFILKGTWEKLEQLFCFVLLNNINLKHYLKWGDFIVFIWHFQEN